jgi:hypothetical protein
MLNPPPEPEQAQAPTRLALRTISETRRILEGVVTSSESFNYPKAKEGLKELRRMIRELGREEARLRVGLPHKLSTLQSGRAKVLPFPGTLG